MSEQSSDIWGCQLTDDEDGFDVCFVDNSVSGVWYVLLIGSGVLGFITGFFLFGFVCGVLFWSGWRLDCIYRFSSLCFLFA